MPLSNLVMALYVNTKSRLKTGTGTTDELEIEVEVHQALPLSPLVFVVVKEETVWEERSCWQYCLLKIW